MATRSIISTLFAVCCFLPGLSAADEGAPLFPFVISYDGAENATSMAHLLDPPAGKHGFIRVEEGRFVNDAGPVRLHATNLTGPANFPTHEDADQTAARLARFGVNCVRLHYMDAKYGNFREEEMLGIVADDPATQRNLDPAQLDRLDYLIAALKRRGIYVNVNLHVARTWDERDGFTGADERPWADKGLDNFEPRMIELQKEYARKLLTHVNPYTGLAYASDPCVAMVELNNENSLFRGYFTGAMDRLPEPYSGEFQRQWNRWLSEKYASTDALREAWEWVATPLSDEQIPEGQFDAPISVDGCTWVLSAGSAEAACQVQSGVLRLDVTQEGHQYFPKLFRALRVRKGRPYTLSFRVRRVKGEGDVVLGMAVADTVRGWRSLGVHQTLGVDADWKQFSYSFTALDDSDEAQFQLTRFKVGSYELDDLSFQSGAKSDLDESARLEYGSIPTVKANGYAPAKAVRDFYQFLVDTERDYWVGMFDYLRDDLKVESVVSGTQLGYSPPFVQAELDYVDNHAYWCHPSPVSPNWRIRNESIVNSMACIRGLAAQRVLGKPYTVSEYNHPFPNQYGAEAQPMLRAYGRLQGWDGVFEYTYNHRLDFQPQRQTYFFSMINRTDVLAHLPACAAVFLRGDVQEAKTSVVAAIDYPTYFDRLTATRSVRAGIDSAGFDSRLTLVHRTAVDLTGEHGTDPSTVQPIAGDQKQVVSDTGELKWNTEEPGAGYFTIDTPNTKLFTGFPHGRTIELGGVTLAIGETRLDWATVSLVSRYATGFGESNRSANILLTATGLCQNQGMKIEQVTDTTITIPGKWGEGPVCVEGIPATITLPVNPERLTCYALDPGGNRKESLPVAEVTTGGSKIVITPDHRTVWYELEIE